MSNSGNRFDAVDTTLTFDGIIELHLDETLLSWDEVCQCKIILYTLSDTGSCRLLL